MDIVDVVNALAKYVIALVVVVGCLFQIHTGPTGTDETQAWALIALIVGWLIRDSAGNSATANAAKIVSAGAPAPGTTTTTPPPA